MTHRIQFGLIADYFVYFTSKDKLAKSNSYLNSMLISRTFFPFQILTHRYIPTQQYHAYPARSLSMDP